MLILYDIACLKRDYHYCPPDGAKSLLSGERSVSQVGDSDRIISEIKKKKSELKVPLSGWLSNNAQTTKVFEHCC